MGLLHWNRRNAQATSRGDGLGLGLTGTRTLCVHFLTRLTWPLALLFPSAQDGDTVSNTSRCSPPPPAHASPQKDPSSVVHREPTSCRYTEAGIRFWTGPLGLGSYSLEERGDPQAAGGRRRFPEKPGGQAKTVP